MWRTIQTDGRLLKMTTLKKTLVDALIASILRCPVRLAAFENMVPGLARRFWGDYLRSIFLVHVEFGGLGPRGNQNPFAIHNYAQTIQAFLRGRCNPSVRMWRERLTLTHKLTALRRTTPMRPLALDKLPTEILRVIGRFLCV